MSSWCDRVPPPTCLQLYGGGVHEQPGRGLLQVGLLAEPSGSGHHDHRLPHHRLPETAIHQEVHVVRPGRKPEAGEAAAQERVSMSFL